MYEESSQEDGRANGIFFLPTLVYMHIFLIKERPSQALNRITFTQYIAGQIVWTPYFVIVKMNTIYLLFLVTIVLIILYRIGHLAFDAYSIMVSRVVLLVLSIHWDIAKPPDKKLSKHSFVKYHKLKLASRNLKLY